MGLSGTVHPRYQLGFHGRRTYCPESHRQTHRAARLLSLQKYAFALSRKHRGFTNIILQFNVEGQDELLSQTIQITIAPMTAIDSTLSTSRRPSLIGATDTRRVQNDSGVQQSCPSNQTWFVLYPLISASDANPRDFPHRMGQRPPVLPPAPAPLVTPNAQIAQVLNTAVEQVSQAVQEQVVSSRHPVGNSAELQALV